MEPKKITAKALDKILEDIKEGSESSIGNYLYKGYRIQISKYKSSGTERYMRLYKTRREQGLCVRCGIKVTIKTQKPESCTDSANTTERLQTGLKDKSGGFYSRFRI